MPLAWAVTVGGPVPEGWFGLEGGCCFERWGLGNVYERMWEGLVMGVVVVWGWVGCGLEMREVVGAWFTGRVWVVAKSLGRGLVDA